MGAKCRISGGTWYANAGTVRITDYRKVKVMSLASWKTTWGLGAYAWTPAQRYAWATNVIAPPRTRAKGVTPLQATNQVLTADLAAKITAIQRGTLYWVSAIQALNWFRATDRLMVSLSIASQLRDLFKMSDEQITQIFKDFSNAEQACDSVEAPAVAMLSNASAWGLGISPALRQTLLQLDSICKNDLSKNVSYPARALPRYGQGLQVCLGPAEFEQVVEQSQARPVRRRGRFDAGEVAIGDQRHLPLHASCPLPGVCCLVLRGGNEQGTWRWVRRHGQSHPLPGSQ